MPHFNCFICISLSADAEEANDLYNLLRDSSTEESLPDDDVKFQVMTLDLKF